MFTSSNQKGGSPEIAHSVKEWLIKMGRDAQKRSFEQSRPVLSGLACEACGDFLRALRGKKLVYIRVNSWFKKTVKSV